MRRGWPALAVVLLLAPGCVLRTLEVKSKPAGATVYLDDQPVGTTPLQLPFDHYGTRAIRVAKRGYRPHQGEVALSAPWYEWFPLDFFSEVLWPGTIHDRHAYAVELAKIESGPADEKATAEFLARAERRLLESRVQGYVRHIAIATAALEGELDGAPAPQRAGELRARKSRLLEALAALSTASGSLADLGGWEAAHRSAVLGE